MERKVIIDVDGSEDAAVALLMAVSLKALPGHCESLSILAITCSGGPCGKVESACGLSLMVLEACKQQQIPVYKGAIKPLVSTSNGFGNPTILSPDASPTSVPLFHFSEPSLKQLQQEPAAIVTIDIIKKYPYEITYIALGGLTNLALAMRVAPDIMKKLGQLNVMGDAIEGMGLHALATTLSGDPEAANIVLHELYCPIIIVPVHEVVIDWGLLVYMNRWGTDTSQLHLQLSAREVKRQKIQLHRHNYCPVRAQVVAFALLPDVALDMAKYHCTMETHGNHTRGKLIVDYTDRLKETPNVVVVTDFDAKLVADMYIRMVQVTEIKKKDVEIEKQNGRRVNRFGLNFSL